ncbi:hypothetical protein ACLB2K_072226 [Fragaria x ananassa]
MLETAMKYEVVFGRMVEENGAFKSYFQDKTKIDKACESSDEVLKRVAASIKEKFDKYLGSFEVVNKVTMIANVLDPRYKL